MNMLMRAFVVFVSLSAFGQDASRVNARSTFLDGFEPTSWTLSMSYRSKYVFSNAANLHDAGVIQTDLFILTKSGFALDIWASFPTNLGSTGEDYATEVYPTLAWNGKVGDFNLSIGVSFEDLHPTLSLNGGDFYIFSGEISRDFELTTEVTLSPFIRAEVNFTLDGSVKGDTMLKAGTRFAWKATDFVSLTGKAMLIYDPGLYGADVAWVANVEASLLWKLSEHVLIELPYLRYVDPFTSPGDGRESDFIFGTGIIFKF
jgi:hypothetical protein